MPELPEVETIKRDLEKVIVGKKITGVCVYNPKIIREPGLAAFKKGLAGAVIKKILRRAKVLILELSSGESLVAHLKMTGQLVYPGGGKNSRVAFHLSDGKILDFNDQRLFAELRLLKDWRSLKFIQGLGPEPADLNLRQFKEMLDSRKTAIKPLLMDQEFISGIGNIYAAEILFRAKIHPERRASKLRDKEKELLFKAINDILNAAILHAGSSVDDYVRVSGEKGGYVKYHKVYGRQGKSCLVCKTTIKKISQGGRGTHFCPRCQR
ncbi:MAG: bifunctional DNA-formamidopyrimidine glycosylase/DNA-(apurinic or apyrimidinic site) lyase [Candidatus Omnitrophica bacterium]|nr:bifunctional DNA-formamidopyrimidine glycosylase/DNA-(apurinic or apyrimidinic site) lyase [Candidatus Omnitrophota bacterium]MDD5027670.1 bifunctional DNA-formamidopyrimidine glycosylase/DNA-(apurinic or apyrimidinic site) lyase [Candidatus Omnitrophota bacterium]MDD5661592.1 bifunctional DNA-formamidopyrimidine glycosylase/DNA-(apurinic or apyrimidinic site) lyase [Candidatus Omnitrophota bacterium]